ncbi:MAG: MATE family efflux transporter [Bryobacterales bacterium]
MSDAVQNASAEATPAPSLWQAVRASLSGHRESYTELPLERAILLLAVPMGLELMMESTFGLVDIFFVSKLGPAAVATVGLTGSLIILVFAFAMGLSIAATAVVARRVGEGDNEGASVAAVQAIGVGTAFALPISAIGWALAPHMLGWMGGSPDVVEGSIFTSVMFGGSATIFLIFLNNAIFRGAGDAAIAMRSLWFANLLNMILDPCLIFGWGPFPELGLAGAAVATTIGRGAGVAFQFWALASGGRRVQIERRHIRWEPQVLKRLLSIAWTGMLQFFVGTASWLGIMRIVALFGDVTLAGYTIALRLIHFAILPSWGMSNAASTMVGQNLGAGKPDRAERAVWISGRYNLYVLGTLAVVFWFLARPLSSIFTDVPGALDASVTTLRISSLAYCFAAYSMVFAQAFNGAGDTTTPTKINIAVMWCWQLPLAYLLSQRLGWGLRGVLIGVAISMATAAFVGGVVFNRGGWKNRKV